MKIKELSQTVCDSENQPHQLIDDFDNCNAAIIEAVYNSGLESLPPDEHIELNRILAMLCKNQHIENNFSTL